MALKKILPTGKNEMQLYLSSPRASLKSNPLLWYKENFAEYKTIGALAASYLAMMPTSASSERAFSSAGLTCSPLRSRLSEDKLAKVLMIKEWNKFFQDCN